jgi:hypothetical protein
MEAEKATGVDSAEKMEEMEAPRSSLPEMKTATQSTARER